jgi:hypothetical protein
MKKKLEITVLAVLVITAVVVWLGAWKVRSAVDPPIIVLSNLPAFDVENPQVRFDELKRAQEAEYKSNGRNPFSQIAAVVETSGGTTGKVKIAHKYQDVGPPPFVPPPPPKTTADWPANLKFFGYGAVPKGSPRRAFIRDTENETIYVVPEGQTLLGRYRIVKVGNTDLEFQEISSGLPGKAILEEAAAPPNA